MTQIAVSLPQMQALLAALRNSTKQFCVTFRSGGGNSSFRARYSAAPRPVPVDDEQNFHFYQWAEQGEPDGVRSVPAAALVSLTINATEYVLS